MIIHFTYKIYNKVAVLSTKQTVLPCALHNEVWSCVRIGNKSRSTFFFRFRINEISIFEAVMIIQFFLLFINEISKKLSFSCLYCKVFTIYIVRKNVWKLTIIQTTTVPHNSLQVFLHQNACFVGLYFFGGRNEYPFFPAKKTPNYIKLLLSASWTSSTKKDTLFQKSTVLKMEGRKSFT